MPKILSSSSVCSIVGWVPLYEPDQFNPQLKTHLHKHPLLKNIILFIFVLLLTLKPLQQGILNNNNSMGKKSNGVFQCNEI